MRSMNPFALLTADEQVERIRKLASSGMDERTLATVTGQSLTDVRRALAVRETPVVVPASGSTPMPGSFSGQPSNHRRSP
jgi:hypothetical protein